MIQFDEHIFQMGWNHQLEENPANHVDILGCFRKNGGVVPSNLNTPKCWSSFR